MGRGADLFKAYNDRRKNREAENASLSSSSRGKELFEEYNQRRMQNEMSNFDWSVPEVNTNEWHSQEDMDSYISDYKKKYTQAATLASKYGNTNPSLRDAQNKYLQDINSLSKAKDFYSNYLNADAFNRGKRQYDFDQKYQGKSYNEIKEAYNKGNLDDDEREYLKTFTGYGSLADFDAALADTRKTPDFDRKAISDARSNFAIMHAFDEYKDLLNAKDFDKYSDPSRLINTEMGLDENGKPSLTPMSKRYGGDVMERGKGSDMYNKAWLYELPEEMQKVGAYLYQNPAYGADAYKEFINKVSMQGSAENSQKSADAWSEISNRNLGTGAVGTILNTVSRPIQSAGATLEAGASLLTGAEYNPFRGFAGWGRAINQSQQTLSDSFANTFDSEIGQTLARIGYNAATEGVTSRIGQMATGGLYNLVMGGGVFAQTYGDALLSGMSKEQSMGKAIAAGAIETATEMVGMEGALGWMPEKSWWQNILKQSLAEASEEVVGNVANLVYDTWANGKNSEFQGDVQRYMAEGYSEKDARRMAATKFALETVEEAATAALSAGFTGGVQTARTSNVGKNIDFAKLGEAITTYNPDSKTAETYNNLLGNYKEGDKVPAWNRGMVFNQAMSDASAEYNRAMEQGNNQGMENATMNMLALENSFKTAEQIQTERQNSRVNKAVESVRSKFQKNTETATESNEASPESVSGNTSTRVSETSKISTEDVMRLADQAYIDRASKSYNDLEAQLLKENVNTKNVELYKANFDYVANAAHRQTDIEEVLQHVTPSIMKQSTAMKIYSAIRENDAKIGQIATEANSKIIAKWDGEYSKKGTLTTQIDKKDLTKEDKRILGLVNVLTHMGMNINVIKDKNEQNGWVVDKNNNITLNLAAQYFTKSDPDKGRYVVNTLAHESTHWMENVLGKEEFSGFKNLIKSHVGTAKWDQFVGLEIARAKETGDDIDLETAESEATARFCEDMFNDMSVADRLFESASKSQIQRLADAVRKFFEKIRNDLKEWMKGFDSRSEEARFLRQMDGAFAQVQDKWAEMFERALKVNQARQTENQVLEGADIEIGKDGEKSFSRRVDSKGRELSKGQVTFFADESPLLLDADGNLKRYYHGTARKDRIGYVFDPNRATSGPMPFFTDNEKIAENYAKDKEDTSISRDERYSDYYTQFRFVINGKDVSVPEAWNMLPLEKRNEIKRKAGHVHFDDDYEEIIYDEDNEYGNGNFDAYEINRHKGNYLETLICTWVESGDLLNREEDFFDVLRLVGIDTDKFQATWLDPYYRDEGVFEEYIHITNPFNTSDMKKKDIEAIRKAAKSAKTVEKYSADFWDKTNLTPEQWIDKFNDDVKEGTSHSFTTIPDWVTETLIKLGYDGIVDKGGKYHEVEHQVVIPFRSNQVKDIDNLSPTENNDRRYSKRIDSEKVFRTVNGVEIVQNPTNIEYRQMREEILDDYPWLRGTGEPLLRRTFDEDGNEYYWDASQALHSQIEPLINERFNTRTSQQYEWWKQPDKDDYPRVYSHKISDKYGVDPDSEDAKRYLESASDRSGRRILTSKEELQAFVDNAFLHGDNDYTRAIIMRVSDRTVSAIRNMSQDQIKPYDSYWEIDANHIFHAKKHLNAIGKTDLPMTSIEFADLLTRLNECEVFSAVRNSNGAAKVQISVPMKHGEGIVISFFAKGEKTNIPTLAISSQWKKTIEGAEQYKRSKGYNAEQSAYMTATTANLASFEDSISSDGQQSNNKKSSRKVDSLGNPLTENQEEYFSKSLVRDENGNLKVMYHGSPNGGFTIFDDKYGSGLFFTDDKRVAESYAKDGKKKGKEPYSVYLNIENPLEIECWNHKWDELPISDDIDMDEWWDMDFDRSEDGASTVEYVEFAKEHGYDGVIFYNIIDSVGKNTQFPSTVAVVFNSEQAKAIDNENPTKDKDINLSRKVNDTTYDLLNQTKRLERDNQVLKNDVSNLKKLLSMQGKVTKGEVLDEKKLNLAAKTLLSEARSTYDRAELVKDLKDLYGYILQNSSKEDAEVYWDEIMQKAYDISSKVMGEQKPYKWIDDTYDSLLKEIRSARIKLTDSQIAEAKNAFGENYRSGLFGRIFTTKDGRSLDSYWSEWAANYPWVFEEDVNEGDQILRLSEIYDELNSSREVLQYFNTVEDTKQFANEIYNKFWTVSTLNTVADKYEKEINRLKHEHRQAMDKLKESKEKALSDLRKNKDETIKRIREDRDHKLAEYKMYRDFQEAERKQNAEKKAYVDRITDTATTLMDWLMKNDGKNGKSVPDALKPAVTELLEAIDFSSKQALGMRGGKYSGMQTRKDRAIADALDKIRDYMRDEHDDDVYIDLHENIVAEMREVSEAIKKIAESSNGFVLNQMDVANLERLNRIVTAVKTSISNINQRIGSQRKGEISEIAIPDIMDNRKLGQKENLNKLTKGVKTFFEWTNTLPQYAFEHLGKGATEMFNELKDGWNKFAFHVRDIKDFAQKTYTGKEYKKWSENINEYTINGQKIQMTDTQRMSLYCLAQRQQALQHMYQGGIEVAPFEGKNGKLVEQAKNVVLTKADIDMITGTLDERQIEVAQKLQEFMNTVCSDWMNEITMKRWGIKGATEENYFPINVDDTSLVDTGEPRDMPKSIFKLLNMGFTKPLNEKASNPIVVDDIVNVFETHATDMAKYNALALPVLDMHRYYNFNQKTDDGDILNMKKSIQTAYGKDAQSYITRFLLDLNANKEYSRGSFWFNRAKGYKVAAVAGNLQVAALQPVAIVRSKLYLSNGNLLRGLAHIPSGIKSMLNHSGIAVWKDLSLFDTDVARGIDSQIKQNDSIKDKFVNFTMKLAEWADKVTWGAIWSACESEQMRNGLKGEELIKATTEEFENIIYHTQVVDSTMTRSEIMRGNDPFTKMLTSFLSEPTISMNLLQDAGVRYAQDVRRYGKAEAFRRNGKNIARCAYIYTLNAAVEAIIRGLMGKYRDWDEESDEMLQNMWKEFMQNMIPLGNIPVGRDIMSALQGYNVDRMDMASIQSLINAGKSLSKVVTGDKDMDYKTIYRTMQAISQATGIPLSSLMRDGAALWNNTIGQMYPSLYIK